jgi:hypothetical protein
MEGDVSNLLLIQRGSKVSEVTHVKSLLNALRSIKRRQSSATLCCYLQDTAAPYSQS